MKLAGVLTAFAQLLIATAIAGLAYVGYLYMPRVEQYLNNQARQDCAMAYRLEYLDEKSNTTIMRPIDDLYQRCLEDKNVR